MLIDACHSWDLPDDDTKFLGLWGPHNGRSSDQLWGNLPHWHQVAFAHPRNSFKKGFYCHEHTCTDTRVRQLPAVYVGRSFRRGIAGRSVDVVTDGEDCCDRITPGKSLRLGRNFKCGVLAEHGMLTAITIWLPPTYCVRPLYFSDPGPQNVSYFALLMIPHNHSTTSTRGAHKNAAEVSNFRCSSSQGTRLRWLAAGCTVTPPRRSI